MTTCEMNIMYRVFKKEGKENIWSDYKLCCNSLRKSRFCKYSEGSSMISNLTHFLAKPFPKSYQQVLTLAESMRKLPIR